MKETKKDVSRPVKLKNGSFEVFSLVNMIRNGVLPRLMREDPMAFYDLVMKCRDDSYEFFSEKIKESLVDLELIQSVGGKPHASIRNIVICSVVGEGLEMILVDPEEQKEKKE